MITEQTTAPPTDVDVVIVGAGISGIGAAWHLAKYRPQTSFAVLEGRHAIGGTWSLFQYPGIRSDSDLHTFGFGFKPWTNPKAIAEAPAILDYLNETIDENHLGDRIHFGQHVANAEWSSADQRWTVTTEGDDGATTQVRCCFLFSGTGYYDYAGGYAPEFAGTEDFAGQIIHPQQWPEDLDYTGKRVVIIGSGATAVTLVPAMAGKAGHVTMLQRSPSYIFSLPAEDPIANTLNKVLSPERAFKITRRKNVAMQRAIYRACRRWPRGMRRLFEGDAKRRLPKGYDVATHFSPSYDPWDQRLCIVPDGDLFDSIKSGRASVVTDTIDTFTPTGIRLSSGRELEADIVVTATGLNLQPLGGIDLVVDGAPVSLPDTTVFKSMMLSGVPNFAFAIGYTNSSWTLKVDLVCEHFCRLLDHMDGRGLTTVVPVLGDTGERGPLLDLSSGYVQRAIGAFPRAGTRGPWTAKMAYEEDVARLRHGPVQDAALEFGRPVPTEQPVAA